MRFTVRLQRPNRILLEVGPGHLCSSAYWQASGQVVLFITASPGSTIRCLVAQHLRPTLAGGSASGGLVFIHEQRHRVPLPSYPFERQRYWIERAGEPSGVKSSFKGQISLTGFMFLRKRVPW